MTIRADQVRELENVQEKLVDVVLREADPSEWERDTTPAARKARIDQKRSAVQTLSIISKISTILNYLRGASPADPVPEAADTPEDHTAERDATADEIHAAAQQAEQLLKAYHKGDRKT